MAVGKKLNLDLPSRPPDISMVHLRILVMDISRRSMLSKLNHFTITSLVALQRSTASRRRTTSFLEEACPMLFRLRLTDTIEATIMAVPIPTITAGILTSHGQATGVAFLWTKLWT